MSHPHEKKLNDVAKLLKKSKRVLFITGAGISADSGLPTYRGVGGLYNHNKTEEGYTIEECLSGSMFRKRPEITWKHMVQLGLTIAQHQPNQAHHIIAQWEEEFRKQGRKVVVVTQNVDGYHRAAGSRNVYEFHGSFGTIYCTNCPWSENVQIDASLAERLEKLQESLPPRCPQCGEVIRPKVVLFEENLPLDEIEEFEYEFNGGRGFDLVFSIGTSAMFPYIYGPFLAAASRGIATIDINPVESDLSRSARIHLPISAMEAMVEINRRYQENQEQS